jgi:hypothetical protein
LIFTPASEPSRPAASAEAAPAASLRAFLLQELARRFALGGVKAAIAILVELFHQLGLLLHAPRPAESATSRATGTEGRRPVETRISFRLASLGRRNPFALGRIFRSLSQ